jgi:F-type H+-transporting ATPase subunit O
MHVFCIFEELTKQVLEDIKNAMKGYLKPGQTLKIEQKVRSSCA